MQLKGSELGDFARQLLQKKSKQSKTAAPNQAPKSATRLHVGIDYQSFHPSITKGVSAHIKERLKKLEAKNNA